MSGSCPSEALAESTLFSLFASALGGPQVTERRSGPWILSLVFSEAKSMFENTVEVFLITLCPEGSAAMVVATVNKARSQRKRRHGSHHSVIVGYVWFLLPENGVSHGARGCGKKDLKALVHAAAVRSKTRFIIMIVRILLLLRTNG